MKLGRAVAISVVVFGAVISAVSCAKTDTGTDSNTHWLDECDSDTDCGNLSCLCGVCTKGCSASSACAGLGSDATCGTLAACGAQGNVCLARSEGGPGSGGGTGTAGRPATGGAGTTGGSGAGAGGAADIPDAPATGPCAPMNARDNPSFCGNDAAALPTRYHWNGTTCLPSTCCAGPDCNDRYDTAEACDAAHSACYADDGIARSCTTNDDCILAERTCCFCGETGAEDVIAIRESSEQTWAGNRCANTQGECPPCAPIENPSLSAICFEGRCKVLDVEPFAVCDGDQDCAFQQKSCCETCPATADGFAAVSVDDSLLGPFRSAVCERPPGEGCNAVACLPPDNLAARCQSGHCAAIEISP
jgi:hypothetical protein